MTEREELQDINYGHTQYSVMNVTTKDSMADDELEEIEDNLANLILEEEDFQLKEGCLVPEAAKKASIPRSTAYRMWNEFNERDGPRILIEEHTQLLIKYIDSNAAPTVDLAHDELCKAFPGLRSSVNAVYKHMRTKCNLSLKRAEILCEERDSDTTIRKRKLYIEKYEAGFNLHIMRNRAWAPKNKPAKVNVPTQKGTSVTIMGCISSAGIIDISKRNPGVYKKRRVPGTSKTVKTGKGTNTDHILIFLKSMLITHDDSRVPAYIEARGYKPWFLPPYSSFLNPIEEI
ncbi:hypothetical protein G6F24_011945 [Rhizopus arrhizus]|nr:hypothetical protein G6F24_011945 [Rhizopus arrhizus]